MTLNDFDYDLPERLIAQTPVYPRDASRLLRLDRVTGCVSHKKFTDITEILREGDCLILNDSRVIPARLRGTAGGAGGGESNGNTGGTGSAGGTGSTGGGESNGDISSKEIEVLLLRRTGPDEWECLTRPGKKTRIGAQVFFNGGLSARVTGELDGGVRVLKFSGEITGGETPLPPYIREKLADSERYQTVYAREPGSAAAPTAGLHFTEEVLEKLKNKGVALDYITLHVGLGTFRPVQTEKIADHKMHTEYYTIPRSAAETIARMKRNGGRVIAAGTTACRALESSAGLGGAVAAGAGDTDIFITPGYEFKVTDGLLTNFHLPKSTLIMLVSAFAGRENVLGAYQAAIKEEYRFFSFGDAMLIV